MNTTETKYWKPSEKINQFLIEQDICTNSKKTYQNILIPFFIWLAGNSINIRYLNRVHVINYKTMLHDKGLSIYTINNCISVLRQFFKWTEFNNYHPDITKGVKLHRRPPGISKKTFSVDQIQTLLNSIDRTSLIGLRDYAIINLLIRTGLRGVELCRLDANDLTEVKGPLGIMIQGKGRVAKDSFIALTDKSTDPLLDYLSEASLQKDSPMFVSLSPNNYYNRLSLKSLQRIFKSRAGQAGLPENEYSLHCLRHTCAVTLLKEGASIYDIQKYLRHSNVSTTNIYLKTIQEEIRMENKAGKLLDKLF